MGELPKLNGSESVDQNGHSSSSSSSKSVSPIPALIAVAETAKEVVAGAEAAAEDDTTGFILIKGRERKHSTSSRMSGYNRNSSGRPGSNHRRVHFKKGGDTVSESGKKKSFDEKRDEEKLKYVSRFGKKDTVGFEVKSGDLFSAPIDVSLVHCVSEDFEAKDGIAKQFKDRFGAVDKLIAQSKRNTNVASLVL